MKKIKNQKAIDVATDVLKHLNGYTVKRGAFVAPRSLEYDSVEHCSWDKEFECILESTNVDFIKECRVCALGACFLSTLNIVGFKPACAKDFYTEKITESAITIFGEENAQLIEIAFELNRGWGDAEDYELGAAAVKFGKRFRSDKGRLRAIMQNVIDNKGHFVPTKEGK